VLIYTAGVDTYKMGLHAIYVTLAQRLGITILGFDISGTSESAMPLSVKGDELVLGIVKEGVSSATERSRISNFRSAAIFRR
jgi:hypothetical protein